MSQGFDRREVSALLVRCHRRCCVCHRFCGTKIETDHIEPVADGGDHSIENAIPVCFDCHAEIHAYNPRHPRGRKFTADELRGHKAEWLRICSERPEIFVEAHRNVDIGPLQGMLDELDFNLTACEGLGPQSLGFLLRDEQLGRAVKEGVLSMLEERLRVALSKAYASISAANEAVRGYMANPAEHQWGLIGPTTLESVRNAVPRMNLARNELLRYVQSEDVEAAPT